MVPHNRKVEMSKWSRKGRAPEGFEYLRPTLDALERELRERMAEPHEGKRACESLWPVQQLNWQRSRYVFDMFYKHRRVSREVYDYCVRSKLVDAALIAKWKKPGYERLCSTFAINPKNYNYGTVSICRVPRQQLSEGQAVQEKHSGCRGCASGPGGRRNIFGNKYGQSLARIQIAREEAAQQQQQQQASVSVWADEDEERRYASDQEEDEGTPARGEKRAAERPNEQQGEEQDEDSDSDSDSEEDSDEEHKGEEPAAKKTRTTK